jgi:hypothetical protein
MSKIPSYEGPAFPLSSPIEELTATCTAPYNHHAVGFRNCESAFYLARKILGGWDIIKEFVVANIWSISYGWAPTEILFFNVIGRHRRFLFLDSTFNFLKIRALTNSWMKLKRK